MLKLKSMIAHILYSRALYDVKSIMPCYCELYVCDDDDGDMMNKALGMLCCSQLCLKCNACGDMNYVIWIVSCNVKEW